MSTFMAEYLVTMPLSYNVLHGVIGVNKFQLMIRQGRRELHGITSVILEISPSNKLIT